MNETVKKVIEKIEKQQEGLKNDAAFVVGEQLKDMVSSEPQIAELLDKDLDVENMSIKNAEKKIKDYADNHRFGKCGFVPAKEADRILREFYGLPGRNEEKAEPEQVSSKVIDLTAFL